MDKEGIKSLLKSNEAAMENLNKEYAQIGLPMLILGIITLIGRAAGLILFIGMFVHWFNNSSMTFMEITRESLFSHFLWWIYWAISLTIFPSILREFRKRITQVKEKRDKVNMEILNLKSELNKIE